MDFCFDKNIVKVEIWDFRMIRKVWGKDFGGEGRNCRF